ncbi:hypothetical protein [Jannaschia donghaensis]|nr:hypothetical protein [Jannaschia donghaensis]
MRITFDTNCLINHFDTQSKTATSSEEIAQLLRYATSGKVSVVISTRAEADLDQDKDRIRRDRIKRNLAMFDVIGSVLRWDESKWDGGDVWADGEPGALADEIQKILFPSLKREEKRFGNKIRDVDHLVAHARDKRDIFVTDDGHLNRRADELAKFGIVVMRPGACLSYVDSIEARSVPRTLLSDALSEYHCFTLSGAISFDYSNNNGRYALGEGHFLFETQWSKAGKMSIHAYKDPSSIDGLALAKDVDDISQIVDASSYDYSSRTRTPRLGQVVVWRNANGIYAATKIIEIDDDGRGDASDRLDFEFKIAIEGKNFA